MGSPLGPTLANAFLCHYEKLWLHSCPPEFKPVVYGRYVDEIFVLFKSKDHLLLFAEYMNTRHKKLKFTFDFEQNNSFFFLGFNPIQDGDEPKSLPPPPLPLPVFPL